jgi:hypothetical protein
MKKLLASFLAIAAILLLVIGCQKETSFESGGSPAEATLQSDVNGDCLPKNVIGVYEAGTALNGTTNYIEVDMLVATGGTYTVYTDTVNGVYFRLSGTFTATGNQTIKLRGFGTPATSGTFNFRVRFEDQECIVPVDFLPSGAGGPATFTFDNSGTGTPPACTGFVLGGTYGQNVAMNSTNTVTLNVNVTIIGTYTITSTTANGVTFSKTGAFLNTGAQTVVLIASGLPAAAGDHTFSVTVGTSTCSFVVTFIGPAIYTPDCSSAIINGVYEETVPLDASNTIDIVVNASQAGAYSFTTTTVNGMTFTSSGTLVLGAQTITLTPVIPGSTPTNDGDFNITVPGTPSCQFTITVDPTVAATGTWTFKEGTVTYSGTISEAAFDNTSLPPAVIFYCYGTSTSGEEFEIDLLDITPGTGGVINSGEQYDMSTFTGTSNTGGFYFVGIPPKTYEADPSITGNTVKAIVTSHNTATKTMSGTFSQLAQDNTGAFKNITQGQFTVTYH